MGIDGLIFSLGQSLLVPGLTPESVAGLYVGPDQILPLTSFFGAALGILLMFWNRAVGMVRKVWDFLNRR